MPIHNYRCATCGKESFDQWAPPDCCNKPMDIAWAGFYSKRPFKEFTTRNVNGEPMTITSLAQLRQVEKQYGVNFPAYGGSMMADQRGLPQTHWEDDQGNYHRD